MAIVTGEYVLWETEVIGPVADRLASALRDLPESDRESLTHVLADLRRLAFSWPQRRQGPTGAELALSTLSPVIIEHVGPDDVIGLAAAAKLRSCSRESLRERVHRGTFPARRLGEDGPFVFARADLEGLP